ncbi:HTH_MerR-like domain containing protein [Acidimicrobiia bacterium]
MAERRHSSIGEVLSLLQLEFPDITISKIRFLESQGLLDPERTPSGYRKFHEEDIERLRWILTEQRDHFLPLKVIKTRLASGDLTSGSGDGVLALEPAAASEPKSPSTSRAFAVPDETPTAVSPAPAPAPAATAAADHSRARAVAQLVEGPEESNPKSAAAATRSEPNSPPVRRRHPTGHSEGDPTPARGGPDEPTASLTLSAKELAARTGLTLTEVADLEKFGLISSQSDGKSTSYDQDAVDVAQLSAGFRRYGIEPRHLRMYKVAADRESALFEQLIAPLLKQRRAGAREQAVEMLEDLAELADDLRAAMVRAALKDFLGAT